MPVGDCALCLATAELSDSHVIPNAYFRDMKREKSGRLISFDDNPANLVRYSTESWSEPLLCMTCEQKVGKWETWAVEALRKTRRSNATSSSLMVPFSGFDYSRLNLFLLSILWRASVSSLPPFVHVKLSPLEEASLRIQLFLERPAKSNQPTVRLRRIVDTSHHFPPQQLERVLTSPTAAENGRTRVVMFVFGGFFIEFFLPTAPLRVRQTPSIIRDTQSFFVAAIPMLTVPPLRQVLLAGYAKAKTGKVAR